MIDVNGIKGKLSANDAGDMGIRKFAFARYDEQRLWDAIEILKCLVRNTCSEHDQLMGLLNLFGSFITYRKRSNTITVPSLVNVQYINLH